MDKARPHRKILRSPSVKRKSKALPINQRVQLQRVLGVTVSSNAGIACDSNFGTIAYPAGCVVVLFNPRRNKQSYIFNTTKKPITCLAFSRDGKHLVTGEIGHQPAVRVWDVQEKTQVAEFHGHKFGINCVAFSPTMKEIVSVGTQHDMMINVWNWKSGNKVASNKISSKVSALTFSEDGKCFMTVGNRHVRFWYLDDKKSKINQTVPLSGRSGILGDQKDNFFCDVVAGQGHMCGRFFVITQSGLLCEFNEKRQLDKWVELRTKSANCITAGQEHIFVGCAEGVVRVFSATTLHYLCSIPKPHHLGVEVTSATSPSHMVSNREDAKYPDTKAITIDDDHKKVTCIYNDQSVYIWDVHDIKRVGKAWSFLYHSGCIWALEVYPSLEDEAKAMLPPGSFLTASGDNTIRVWNLNTHMPENTAYRRNIYSNELLKIVYVDPSLASLCNVAYNPAGASDKTDTSYDAKNGVRSIRVSPDGADLASGDRQGNIRIYDMQYLNEKKSIEAHESDVMCLEYSYTNAGHFLATSSRDRLIHVFDVDENYGLLQTLGDHSSSITAVRFTELDNKLRMISCGADKSILIRNALTSPEFQFQLEHHLATKITLYDMVIDPTQKLLATACQDRNVRLYNIQTTKEKKCYKGSAGDEGILLRIHLDPSGTYVATTCTDKNVCILDFQTGELMATMYGHSEVITGVKFVSDLKHVITVSADGCIYVWRLPIDMTNQMKGRLLELGKTMKDIDYFRPDQALMPNPVMLDSATVDGTFPVVKSASTGHISMFDDDDIDSKDDDEFAALENFDDAASHTSLDYRFSIGQLPNWAKAKFGETHSEGSDSSQEVVQLKGKWAQRVDHNVEFKSQLDLTSEEDPPSDRSHSREASSAKLSELRRETIILGKNPGNKDLPQIGDDLGPTDDMKLFRSPQKHFQTFDAVRKTEGFGQYKSDTSLNTSSTVGKSWSDRFNMLKSRSLEFDDTDDLDTGSDTTEIIYPPTDSDSDLFASSYKVFAVDDVKQDKVKANQGNVSNQDDNSVSTDPISLEDEDEPSDEIQPASGPTTPSDPGKEFLSTTPDKEDFVRENFEEDSFTPVPLEKFTRSLDTLEQQQMAGGASGSMFESTPFSPRLSLSARFMSGTQPSSFKNYSSQITYRQDNWFNRNKFEMTKTMDETRKSLLAMNQRRSSSESESPEKEDPPSPPTKLEQGASFPSNNQTRTSYPTSPPTEFEIKNSLKDLPKSLPQAQSFSPVKTNHLTITSTVVQKITDDRRRSSAKTGEQSEASRSMESSGPKYVARTRPTYFKPTLSSKTRSSRHSETSTESPSLNDKPHELINKKVKNHGKMPASKLTIYASTPNLISGLSDDDETEEDKPQINDKLTSNLRLLSELSHSVPDVKDIDSHTDKSSGGQVPNRQPQKSVTGKGRLITRLSVAVNEKQMMPPPKSIPASSSRVVSSSTFTHSRRDVKEHQLPVIRGKPSASQLTLDQAKSILLGKSGVLGGINKQTDNISGTTFSSSRSARNSRSSVSSSLTSVNSHPAFDAELAHANPTDLAVAEEIEHTANMLRHQNQANIINTLSEHMQSLSSNLEASPLDLPERDQPNRLLSSSPKQPQRPLSLSPQQGGLSLPTSQAFQHCFSLHTSDSALLATTEEHSDDVFDESVETDDKPKSVKDRIARYQSSNAVNGVSKRNSSPYRRLLPASPNIAVILAENSKSDTGVGSESSDIDTSGQLLIATNETRSRSLTSIGTGIQSDISRLAARVPSSSPVSINHCQSVINDFKAHLHKLKDLFIQVDSRTDDNAQQVLAMLGEVVHEAKDIISDLASKTPSPSTKTNIVSLNAPLLSSSLPQGSRNETFHSASSKQTQAEAVAMDICKTISEVASRSEEPTAEGNKGAILSATKDLLQPLVSQLSQDLSEGIWKLIKEKVEETF